MESDSFYGHDDGLGQERLVVANVSQVTESGGVQPLR